MYSLPERTITTVAMPNKMSRSNSPPNNNTGPYLSGLKRKGSMRKIGVAQAKPFRVIVLGQASVGKTGRHFCFFTIYRGTVLKVDHVRELI